MNPLDLRGPDFLGFYFLLFLAAVAAAFFLRRFLRLPGDEPSREALDLSPYEVAYLAGGEELTVNAAMGRLVHENVLAVDAINRRLTRHTDELRENASKLERTVFSAVNGERGETIANVRSQAARMLAPIRARLRELELLVSEEQAWMARLIPLFIVLSVAFLGVLKILDGLSRNRPVIFLVLFCIITVVVAFVGFGRAIHRSRRGDRALDRLRKSNVALEYSRRWRPETLAGDDVVLALGLFGMGVVAGGALAKLQTALKPPHTPVSSGGCGSTGCGGGGGGCGGGGGGCGGGGGGCGGCGG
jgi:uncharacterized protein (TIGR04222 family)